MSRRDVGEEELRSRLLARPAFGPGGRRALLGAVEARASALLPGAFDPFHPEPGRPRLERRFGRRVDLQLSARSTCKTRPGEVRRPDGSIDRRSSLDAASRGFTAADPWCIDKARLFPGDGRAGRQPMFGSLGSAWGRTPGCSSIRRWARGSGRSSRGERTRGATPADVACPRAVRRSLRARRRPTGCQFHGVAESARVEARRRPRRVVFRLLSLAA